jgi:hypothetical protein
VPEQARAAIVDEAQNLSGRAVGNFGCCQFQLGNRGDASFLVGSGTSVDAIQP